MSQPVPLGHELFSSTAAYYRWFRMPYPESLIDLIRARYDLDGSGALLEVGCGTGQLSVQLSSLFKSVIGIDISSEMVAEAELAVEELSVRNGRFEARGAESITANDGPIRLATFGSSLHWLDFQSVLDQIRKITHPGGSVVVVGMRSIWGGQKPWELAAIDVVRRWLGDDRRAGDGTFSKPNILYDQAISNAGFNNIESGELNCEYSIDINWIVGHLYSTSYRSRDQLGDKSDEFEADLKETLLALD